MSHKRIVIACQLAALFTLASAAGHAQDYTDCSTVLNNCLSYAIFGRLNANDIVVAQTTRELSRFPIGSGSGGVPGMPSSIIPIPLRESTSFGPSFAERALSSGAKRLSAGLGYQFQTYRRSEGHTTIVTDQRDYSGSFVVNERTTHLKMYRQVIEPYVTYGLRRNVDVSVFVPIIRTHLEEWSESRQPSTGRYHGYSYIFGTATRIGDVTTRAKIVGDVLGSTIGVFGDVSVPTGSTVSLTGIGYTTASVTAVWSANHQGRIQPHANVGWLIPLGGEPVWQNVLFESEGLDLTTRPHEWQSVFGVDAVASTRLTVSVDASARVSRRAGRVKYGRVPVEGEFVGYLGEPFYAITAHDTFYPVSGNLTTGFISVGGKYGITSKMLLAANTLMYWGDYVFRPGITFMVATELSVRR